VGSELVQVTGEVERWRRGRAERLERSDSKAVRSG
jgi:hypothetical protein